MKFNEKLLTLRKQKGLSQEELGMELEVSRQTVSKWEAGQCYPDFERLVRLSDYFDLTLDQLVKDIDVQDVREKNLTNEKISSLFQDVEQGKALLNKVFRVLCWVGLAVLAAVLVSFVAHLLFPQLDFLWRIK